MYLSPENADSGRLVFVSLFLQSLSTETPSFFGEILFYFYSSFCEMFGEESKNILNFFADFFSFFILRSLSLLTFSVFFSNQLAFFFSLCSYGVGNAVSAFAFVNATGSLV